VKYTVEEATAGGAWSEIGWFSRAVEADAVSEFERGVEQRHGIFRLADEAGREVAHRVRP
jgi:hypothetical protein